MLRIREVKDMSIFILEDDVFQQQQMKQKVENICTKHAITYDFIEVTSKEERIISSIPLTTKIPIYFLDIEIKKAGRKGLEVAQHIRTYDQQGIIVFVTTHANLAPISYQYMVSALSFIDKGLAYEKRLQMVEQALLHYQMRNEEKSPTDDFVLDHDHATIRLPFKTVEYIMTASPHRLELVTTNRIIQFYGTLKEVEMIDDRLIRCHQSYIVNKEQIALYDSTRKSLILKSGKQVPVSRRLVRKVKQMLKG